MKKKVLIIRLTALGDVIFTLPLVNALNDNGWQVDYLVAEKGFGPVNNNPSVNKVHLCPLAKWRKNPFSIKNIFEFWKLITELRKEHYDVALDCQQMWKSLWLLAFCKAKRRITFSDAKELSNLAGNEFIKPKFPFKDNNYHIVERNLDFARHLKIDVKTPKFTLPPVSNKTIDEVNSILHFFEGIKKPLVVIAPATTWANKHWNKENWKNLIKQIKNRCNIVFTGMNCDKDLIDELMFDGALNLCGATNIEQLKEILSRAVVVLTPDSGTAHLSWALNKPNVIAIFTCTPPKRFGPYGDKYHSISGNIACQPCFKRKCKYKTNACTNGPSVDKVLETLNQII